MKKASSLLLIIALLGAGCVPASPSAPSRPADSGQPASPVSTASQTPAETPAGNDQPQTATAVPQVTPSPAPSSAPATIGADNFAEFAAVQTYLTVTDELVREQYDTGPFDWRIDTWTYSPDGRYLAIGGCTTNLGGLCYGSMAAGNGFLYILDAQTAEPLYIFHEEDIEVTGLSFSADGKWLAYATCPQQLRLFNMESMQTEKTLWRSDGCKSRAKVAIRPDGKQLALVVGTQLLVFDLTTGRQIAEQAAQRHGSVLPAYSSDGTRLAVFSAPDGQEVVIYDTDTWQRTTRITVSDQQVGPQAVSFSADGRRLAIAENRENTDILLWDTVTGQQIGRIDPPLQFLYSLAFTPDGRLLLASGLPPDIMDTRQIMAWDASTLQLLGAIHGSMPAEQLRLAADGKSFMTLYMQNLMRWSLPDVPMIAARQAVDGLFAALVAGDYQSAASLYQPMEGERRTLLDHGLDPADLPSTLQALCAGEGVPCLPITRFVSGEKVGSNEYLFRVTFTALDGSLLPDAEGYTSHAIYAILLPDGSGRVASLPVSFFMDDK